MAPYGSFTGETTIDPAVMQIDEPSYLGEPVAKDYTLVDESGQEFMLGALMGKPLILLLSYYGCDGTCPTLNTGLMKALQGVERFRIGRDYNVLTVSFDRQDNPETMARFMEKVDIPVDMRAGWRHALLKQEGEVERLEDSAVGRLTGNVGYKFFWSPADQVFLHPNVVIFLTPEGRIARYLYGTAMEAAEMELALIDADWSRIANSSNVIDMLAGVCFSFNYAEGKYTFNYSLLIGVLSLLAGVSMVVFSLVVYRKKHSRRLSHV